MEITCYHCGAVNEPGSARCSSCGKSLFITCTNCGAQNHGSSNFCAQCGTRLRASKSLPAAVDLMSRAGAERRLLTVMFCDVKDSTALAAMLDPEDLREIMRAYQEICSEVVEQFEGYLAQYLGDGVLIYFGYPAAHENEAERAVYAGRAILSRIKRLAREYRDAMNIEFAVRIGVHSGLVVVGELGTGTKREQLAVGQVPNVAARLQGLAEPNTMVISTATHRLVESAFRCRSLGIHNLKGLSSPEEVFVVESERDVYAQRRRRLESNPVSVGRSKELGDLLKIWQNAAGGSGSIVAIEGEAGIGKSYFVEAFEEEISNSGHHFLRCSCSAYYRHRDYHPFIDLLTRTLNFYPEQPDRERLDMVSFLLQRNSLDDHENRLLLASLLEISPEEGSQEKLNPVTLNEKTEKLLSELIRRLASDHPLLIVIEDFDFADTSTIRLVNALEPIISRYAILLILTGRLFSVDSRVAIKSRILLKRLSDADVKKLVAQIAGPDRFPPSLINLIVERSDGIPLYAAEVTRMLLDAHLPSRENWSLLHDDNMEIHVPLTLQDSLMARLDRLSKVKQIAQLGAVMGREFRHEWLVSVSGLSETTIDTALEELVEADILEMRGQKPNASYRFTQALIQEAAYDSLLRTERLRYHHLIARALEDHFPDVVEQKPEILAGHFARANMGQKALEYFLAAGVRALNRFNNREAAYYFRRAVELLEANHTDCPEMVELRVRSGHAMSLLRVYGYGDVDVLKAYTAVADLCMKRDVDGSCLDTILDSWSFFTASGRHENAAAVADRYEMLSEKAGSAAHRASATSIKAAARFWKGDFEEARHQLESVIAHFDGLEINANDRIVATIPITARSYLSYIRWYDGWPDRSLALAQEAFHLATQQKNPLGQGFAGGFRTLAFANRRQPVETARSAEELLILAREYDLRLWIAVALVLKAWAAGTSGKGDADAMLKEMGGLQQQGIRVWMPQALTMLAAVFMKNGGAQRSIEQLAEAEVMAYNQHEPCYLPEIWRIRGSILISSGMTDEGMSYLHRSLDESIRRRARMLQLRTLTDLARFDASSDRWKTELAGHLATFEEGQDLPDFLEARQVLGLGADEMVAF